MPANQVVKLPLPSANGPTQVVLDVTAATALRTSACMVAAVSVITEGWLYDAGSIEAATADRQIWVIPATAGVYPLNWPCVEGLVAAPGTNQAIAVTLY